MKIVFLILFDTVSLFLQMTLRFNDYIENGYAQQIFYMTHVCSLNDYEIFWKLWVRD